MKRIKDFWIQDDGAVTVDWVVLCALVIGFSTAGYLGMHDAISGVATAISDVLTNWTF
ncbi:hypothetical protein [Arenibacterium sp. LLYu02]|uniref:hypothetical protein n=1 Tax=Arenibacterium sp. LLYu02 TaxID=3404132 RepID=UPI003B2206A8